MLGDLTIEGFNKHFNIKDKDGNTLLRNLSFGFSNSTGRFAFFDHTNAMDILSSEPNGTNIFYGRLSDGGLVERLMPCHEIVNGLEYDGFKLKIFSATDDNWQIEFAIFWNLKGVYGRKRVSGTWSDWAKSGFNNVSTSVRYDGTGSYAVPQTGTYLYTCTANVNNLGGCIPYVNNVAKGTSIGSDGCLVASGGVPSLACYTLDLNAGDTVSNSSAYSFSCALLI